MEIMMQLVSVCNCITCFFFSFLFTCLVPGADRWEGRKRWRLLRRSRWLNGRNESERGENKKEEEKKENSLVVEGLLFSPAENTQWRSSVNTATCMQAQEKVAASTTLGHLWLCHQCRQAWLFGSTGHSGSLNIDLVRSACQHCPAIAITWPTSTCDVR